MAHLKKGADGHLLKGSTGHLVKTCPEGPAPDYCPDATKYTLWQLVDYADYDLIGCEDCLDSAEYPWPGNFIWVLACLWAAHASQSVVSGKAPAVIQIKLDTANRKWALDIICTEGPPTFTWHVIWSGEKLTGQDPGGTYTRLAGAAGGCDTTGQLQVEQLL